MPPSVLIAIASLLVTVAATGTAFAQRVDPRTLEERLVFFPIADVAAIPVAATQAVRRDDLADVLGTHTYAFIHYALPANTVANSFKEFVQTAQNTRVDQQIGSLVSGGGSTTVASRTGLTTMLGFAMEAGAVTQTVEQNVATLRANADGVIRFLTNQEVIPACAPGHPECAAASWLKDVEVAASFNVSDAGTQNLSGTAPGAGNAAGFSALISERQLSSVSARYAAFNSRDPRSPAYRSKWLSWLQSNGTALGLAGNNLLSYVNTALLAVQLRDVNGALVATTGLLDQYSSWLVTTRAALAKLPSSGWPAALALQLDDLLNRMRRLDPEFDSKLSDVSDAYLRYLSLQRSLASTLITDPGLTVDYTYSEPTLQPKLHTVRVAWAFSPRGTRGVANTGTVTINAALDRYHDPQPNESGQDSPWRDAQLALQFDRPLGPSQGAAQLSVGGYFQYQFNPGIFTIPEGATTFPGTSVPLAPAGGPLLAEKGVIFATQAVLTIRLANTGMKVPIGVSWANRSELAPGNIVRGHLGFTFDTTPLFLLPTSR